MTRQLHLGLFIYPGAHHIAGWRHPSTPAASVTGLDFYRDVAQLAERGKFDLFFVGDTLFTREKDGRFFGRQTTSNLDPVSLLSVLSSVTTKLGLVGTLSTTYHEPYEIAAKYATLDHLSGGRAGWNVVTTWEDKASLNFSREQAMAKADRYVRGREFIDVCTSLWDSIDDGAAGFLRDPAHVHPVAHHGDSFAVSGALPVPRPVQGWPVLVQAGGSPPGLEFAALVAEAVFTAQTDFEIARAFRASTHERMARYGRRPDEVVIMPGLSPLLGSTEAEAQRLEQELGDLVHPEVGIWMLSENLGFSLYDRDPDDLLPVDEIRAAKKPTANADMLLTNAARQKLTISGSARLIARSRAHHSFVGTPEQLADLMERWLLGGACDGFNVMPPYFPQQLSVFVEQVVPELQRRGLFREDYEGNTLREHLGLARPEPGRFQRMLKHVPA
ncbi:NtaA/DmoA family FMN-dependent monooxygenase [Paraburkholderia caballeronis]|uniref:NtaA/DmoA family FMN-dependent monooxygenase n=1 Tax=Paraburkholderia caballeronis TaxID=416943 RepID=UPI001064B7E0|nr:NtaA/DmoA family FMN-dependent monooxygenase [Paraburkholderia caballeronis]TDV05499.1 FMN-dependent oxidoreductase (nitrilotriacetate monooxygenase family) [Paraburkholderia caballeronis]TDV09126.1 FMN-dependent oxidoreductase (nitrilotriacetate monooxygenase family) [Paraburkholderia caballeronis]TDV20246.1 FMN-dependent oxidoreductase (nitrilotriacetate monooxygenase family) [Paraburkholderia caballeronis]